MAVVAPTIAPLGHHIVDYFFVAGCTTAEVAEAAGYVSRGDSMALLDLEAHVVDRFPSSDRPLSDGTPGQFPQAAPIFGFPQGFNAVWEGRGAPAKDPDVVRQHAQMSRRKGCFFTFVLTDGDGTRSYGSVLQFLETHEFTFDEDDASAEIKKLVVKVPKILCILSQYGYFSVYQKYLEFLLRTYYRGVTTTAITTTAIASTFKGDIVAGNENGANDNNVLAWPPPLEAEIYRFVLGCKLPQRGYGISYPLGGGLSPLKYCASIGPPAGFPDVDDGCFQVLFQCLSVENLVFVVCSILLEQRILLHSEDLDVLHKCSEALITLLFPLCWQHVYVPLLPAQLLEYLSAPVPFIMGVHTSSLASQEGIDSLPSSVVVHLDYNKVAPPMEVLLPGESGPVLKCTALPDLPHEVRMKLITEITAQVPGWKTKRLERADSGTRLGMGNTSDDSSSNIDAGTSAALRSHLKSDSKVLLSTSALEAVKRQKSVDVKFGPGPVGLALQSTKWIPVGDIFDTVGAAMVRGFTTITDDAGATDWERSAGNAVSDGAPEDSEASALDPDAINARNKALITVGSILVAINGEDTAASTFTETMHKLRFSSRPMTLRFMVAPSPTDDAEGVDSDFSGQSGVPPSRSSSNSSFSSRQSTSGNGASFSGSVSLRWVDKVRSAFLDLMFLLFSGGVKEHKSFKDRMMSYSFGRSSNKRSSMQSNSLRSKSSPKSPRSKSVRRVVADYRTYLPRPTGVPQEDQKSFSIMKRNFLSAQPKSMQKFMAVFVETQAFSNFVTDAAMLHFHGHGSTPSKMNNKVDGSQSGPISYQRESDIEILNQCIQTADVSEGMLLDALCRYDGAEPSMIPAAPGPLEMCGVGRAIGQKATELAKKGVGTKCGVRNSMALSESIFNVLADANYVEPEVQQQGEGEDKLEQKPGSESSEAAAGAALVDVAVTVEQAFDTVSVGDPDASSTFIPEDSKKNHVTAVTDINNGGQEVESPTSASARAVSSKTSPVQTRKPGWVRRTSQMVTLLNPNLDVSRLRSRAATAVSLQKLNEGNESSEDEKSSEGDGVKRNGEDEGGGEHESMIKKADGEESKSSKLLKQERYPRQRAGTSLGSMEFGSGDEFTPRSRTGGRRRGSFQGGVKSKHALARIRTVSAAMVADGNGRMGRSMTSSLASLSSLNLSLHSITESRDDLDELLAKQGSEQSSLDNVRRRSSSDADVGGGGGRRRSSSESSSRLDHRLGRFVFAQSMRSSNDVIIKSGAGAGSGGASGQKMQPHSRHLSQMIVNLDEHVQNNKRRMSATMSLASLAEVGEGGSAAGDEGGSVGDDEREFLAGHIDSVAVMNRGSPSSSVDL